MKIGFVKYLCPEEGCILVAWGLVFEPKQRPVDVLGRDDHVDNFIGFFLYFFVEVKQREKGIHCILVVSEHKAGHKVD